MLQPNDQLAHGVSAGVTAQATADVNRDHTPVGRILPGGGAATQDAEVPPESEPAARVLVVDDSETIRLGMSRLLAGRGYEVQVAADGLEALDVMQFGGVDLLILDLQMPHADGFTVLERLSGANVEVPVILLSGLPAASIQERLGELRAQRLPPLFLKPVDFEQLLGVVDLMLSGDMPDFDE